MHNKYFLQVSFNVLFFSYQLNVLNPWIAGVRSCTERRHELIRMQQLKLRKKKKTFFKERSKENKFLTSAQNKCKPRMWENERSSLTKVKECNGRKQSRMKKKGACKQGQTLPSLETEVSNSSEETSESIGMKERK